ncbi:MAG TPA: PspA/IM30 family protein [Planctomycetaceae bacterium]|nr:PspA/IM30 family protein [Planctomycetaceae bacterium]
MSYFSRLTDIVTCNLSEILANEEDPKAAIEQIVYEIQEGVAGAERSLKTARNHVEKLEQEIAEHTSESERMAARAKRLLQESDEDGARKALVRKSEQLDLVAGLEQQLQSANNLVQHLVTMHRALEARLHDAQRKQNELLTGESSISSESIAEEPVGSSEPSRSLEIENELAALKKELGQT